MPKRSFPISPDTDEGDPANSIYDQEFNGLHGSGDDDTLRNPSQAKTPDELHTLRDAEGGHGSLRTLGGGNISKNGAHDATKKIGGLFNPVDNSPVGRARKILTAVKNFGKKKGAKQGGIAITLVTIVALLGGTLVTHELNDVMNNITREEAKFTQHMDQKLNQRIWNEIVQAAKKKGKGGSDSKQIADEEKNASSSGEELTNEIDAYPITSPAVVDKLAGANWKVNVDANGNFKGISDANSGEDLTDKFGLSDLQGAELDDAMHTWLINLMEQFRPEMTIDAGADFNVIPADQPASQDDPVKEINSAVENGASGDQIQLAETEVNETPPDPNGPPAAQQAFSDAQSDSKLIQDTQKATQENYNKTGDAGQAQQAGEAAANADLNNGGAKLGRSLFLANIASTACTVDKDVTEAADSKIIQITVLLIRNYSTFASLASELNAGKLKAKDVAGVMKIFQGSGLLQKKNSDGTLADSSKTFTASAEWHRVSGKSTAGTPDLSPVATPTHAGPQIIIDTLNKYLGTKLYCPALTSPVGVVLVLGADTVQFISSIADFGASDAVSLAANVGFTITLEKVIVPALVSYVGNIALAPTQNPVALLNNLGAGGHLSFSDYARHSGGTGQTPASIKKLSSTISGQKVALAKQEPWTYRAFAMDNPDSLTSQLVENLPTSTASMFTSLASYFTTFPATVLHSLASMFTPKASADSSNQCGDPHCLTLYTIPDDIINKYGPKEDEQYLFSNVSYGGKSIRRIDALGNPNTYSYSPQGDSNNDDILHCFVDPPSMLADNSLGDNDAAKANCGSMGTFDMQYDGTTGPTDDTIAGVYCKVLAGDAGCLASVKSQIHDDIGHYSSYLGYISVIRGDVSATNNK